MQFKCLRCNYIFRIRKKTTTTPRKCPQCRTTRVTPAASSTSYQLASPQFFKSLSAMVEVQRQLEALDHEREKRKEEQPKELSYIEWVEQLRELRKQERDLAREEFFTLMEEFIAFRMRDVKLFFRKRREREEIGKKHDEIFRKLYSLV